MTPTAARPPVRLSFSFATLALVAYGLIRLSFNTFAIKIFGASFLGTVSPYISLVSVVTFLTVTPIASLLSKYGGELLGATQAASADRLFSRLLLVISFFAFIGSLAFLSFGPPSIKVPIATYYLLLSFYFFFKRALFAFGLAHQYLLAELSGGLTYVLFVLLALFLSSSTLLLFSLSGHLLIFFLISSSVLLRHHFCPSFLKPLPHDIRQYFYYSLSTTFLSLSGMASSHFVIILSSIFLPTAAEVGQLSALLALLSPLNLLPSALATVLLPEFSYYLGARHYARTRRLVLRGAIFLATVFLPLLVLGILAQPLLFRALSVPSRIDLRWSWALLLVSVIVSNTTTPFGQLLNSTPLVRLHALLSALSALVSIAAGIFLIPLSGIVGAALMRLSSSVPLALARTYIALQLLNRLPPSSSDTCSRDSGCSFGP